MTGSPRIFTNLNARQYAELTKWCIRNDRSMSYAVSRAITDHINDVEPYTGEADIKVMARTTPENVSAVKVRGGTGWRIINAAVERMLSDAVERHG